MSRLRTIQLAVVAVTLVVAVVLFLLVVPINFSNTAPLASTIVGSSNLTPLAGAPAFSGYLPSAELPIAAMVQAGKSDPAHTGAWAKQWYPTQAGGPDNLQIQTDVAPSVEIAKQAQSEVAAHQLTKQVIVAGKHTYVGTFSIAPLDGGGTNFKTLPIKAKPATIGTSTAPATPATKAVPAQPGIEIVFRVGRTVVQEAMTGPVATGAIPLALAEREAALVSKVVPALPPLQIRHNPIWSSIVFIAVALVALVALALLPVGIDAAWRRRVAERIVRADRHRRVRGAKALKSQRRRF